ncbi:MAG: hypothetical protein N2044_09700 [Cyclobacteriaceae bacterium]|nr:hypothetical protein [Cyclobacteriaceae bacterium]
MIKSVNCLKNEKYVYQISIPRNLRYAVHYNKVGRNYWIDVIMQYISNYLNTGTAYDNKNNLTAVVESWGYFVGHTFTERKYRNPAPLVADENLRSLERQRRDDTTPRRYNFTMDVWEGWIPWGIPHDLIDTGEPAVTGIPDLVSGYSIQGIFKGYTNTVTSIPGLRSSILSNNNNSQQLQVNNLVTAYGW